MFCSWCELRITAPAAKNSNDLKKACVTKWNMAADHAPTPSARNMYPIWLIVEYASTRLISDCASGAESGDQQGEHSDDGNSRLNRGCQGEDHIHPGYKVYPGSDHCGGMYQGANWSRACHGVGKPGLKRYLGRFPKGSA